MAYTIQKTNNTILTVVEDGTIDNTTDLKLVGKNYSGYGEIQNENFIALLEHFASANRPPRPISGQLWFDTATSRLKLYDGNPNTIFTPLSILHRGPLPTGASITTSNIKEGDLWWDTLTEQLYVYNSSAFILIGPRASQTIKTAVEEAVVFDNLYVEGVSTPADHQHQILKTFVDNRVISIISNDEFTLGSGNTIAGFDRVKKGITLVNTQIANNGVTGSNFQFHGTASNTERLGGTAAVEFIQRTNAIFTSQVTIDDDDGIIVGDSSDVVLKVSSTEPELLATQNGKKLNFKVTSSTGTQVTPLTLTATGPMPPLNADNVFNIGSSGLRWKEVYAVNFRGIVDNADKLLSDGTYRTASRLESVNTVAVRDSVGDIYAAKFRGTAVQSDDSTRADSVKVSDQTDTYVSASLGIAGNKIPVRDEDGNINANQFNGLATRAITLQVPTVVPGTFENRTASVADTASAPNTVAVRDTLGRLHSIAFVGDLIGGSSAASQLATPRKITLAGDVEGEVNFDGSQDVTLNTTVKQNSVALGTDTTGNYVQSVAKSVGETYLNVVVNGTLNGEAGEARIITLGLSASTNNDGNKLVARDPQGSFAGQVITAESKFVGNINELGTLKDGFFNNLTVGTLTISGGTLIPIASGGTGAGTAANARTNLDIYSKAEVNGFISGLGTQISGISQDKIISGSSNVTVGSNSDIAVTRTGISHTLFNSSGIELLVGNFVGNLTGNAASANFADLAEKYTTDSDLVPGTVVMVCDHEDHELESCTETGFPVGVVSTDPAFLMNSGLENGQAIALKGRVPTRVLGAVKKGDLLFAGANGCAVKSGTYKVAIALESNADEGEKLVECMLVM
jgi:hypothetical protein